MLTLCCATDFNTFYIKHSLTMKGKMERLKEKISKE